VIIVDPESVIRPDQIKKSLAVTPVYIDVVRPVILAIVRVNLEIMEQGPNSLVAKSLVEFFNILLRKEDRNGAEFGQTS